ncbi:MAG: protein-glutamine glutaminase family protein [Bdellovibrionales bacterium]
MDYKNARNGCYERAQKINDLLEHNDLLGFQAFIQAEDPEGCGATGASCISSGYPSHSDNVKIQFQSIYSPGTTYRWNYHTTATLCVNRNGVSELYAIDPSTFRQAVPLKEWVRVLSKNLDRSEYSTLVREFR